MTQSLTIIDAPRSLRSGPFFCGVCPGINSFNQGARRGCSERWKEQGEVALHRRLKITYLSQQITPANGYAYPPPLLFYPIALHLRPRP